MSSWTTAGRVSRLRLPTRNALGVFSGGDRFQFVEEFRGGGPLAVQLGGGPTPAPAIIGLHPSPIKGRPAKVDQTHLLRQQNHLLKQRLQFLLPTVTKQIQRAVIDRQTTRQPAKVQPMRHRPAEPNARRLETFGRAFRRGRETRAEQDDPRRTSVAFLNSGIPARLTGKTPVPRHHRRLAVYGLPTL